MLTQFHNTMRMAMSILAVMMFSAVTAPASTRPGNKYVQAQLLADVSQIAPGKPFTLGVLLKITPQWHVYWKNPGDSGLPTTIRKWTLPDGFHLGEVRFPIPQLLELPGNEVNYGYENEVLLICQATPPADLKPGESLNFSAEVSWLVCDKVCLPGRQTVELKLPAGNEATPANQDLFRHWESLLPLETSDPHAIVSPGVTMQSSDLTVRGAHGSAAIQLSGPASEVQWFPLPPDGIGVTDTHAVTTGQRSTYTFTLVPEPASPIAMKLLAVYKDSKGMRHGIMIAAHYSG